MRRGIDVNRIEFVGLLNLADFLPLHHRIDLALDPFPYGGVTTTRHRLWMGLPLVTLAGSTPISRGSAGMLGRLGLSEHVATSLEEHVAAAIQMLTNQNQLLSLGAYMRGRLVGSTFFAAHAVTSDLESAYVQFYRRWCGLATKSKG